MFTPARRDPVAPVTTAVFGTTGATTSAYLEEFRASDMNTKATMGAIIRLFADKSVEPLANDNGDNDALIGRCAALFRPGVAAAYIALVDTAAAPQPSDNDLVNAAIRTNLPNSINWVADLINAAKKKPLTETNVSGYFEMLGHSGTKASAIASLMNKCAPFFPSMTHEDAFRAMLAPGIWTTYRNVRVSTGLILRDLLPVFNDLGITAAGDATEVAINACAAAPWDVELSLVIHDKYKAYGCIYLEAAGTPIESWYQGNKARDALPAVRVRGAREIFRRYLEIKNDVAGINAITTVLGFQGHAIAAFW